MATINERFDDVQRDLATISEQVRAMREETVAPVLRDHAVRLGALERWRYQVYGGAVVAGVLGAGGANWLGLFG